MVDIDRLEAVLIRAAIEQRALTYGEILRYFERRVTPVTVGALCRDLGKVCSRIGEQGGPDLASLVVRKTDGLPGEGYFVSLWERGRYDGPSSGPRAQSFVRSQQEACFSYYRSAGGLAPEQPG